MRESGYQAEFGLLGAGAVNASLIGRWARARSLGPVAAVSYRVASRIANTLSSGTAVRSADELNAVRTIFFHAPAEHAAVLLDVLREAKIEWSGKSLIFCDCEASVPVADEFRALGACVAAIRCCPIPARLVIEGTTPALTTVKGMARTLSMKPIEINAGSSACFEAAVTLGSGALTPLIDEAADLLRRCGVRDTEAPGMAAALFQQTAGDYAHSGKQSWAWYVRQPTAEDLEVHIAAAGVRFQAVMRELLLLGLEGFEKHPEVARTLRAPDSPGT